MPLKSLEMAFVDELKDVYSAEKQITHALPKMAKNAAHDQLRASFEEHLEQTQKQIDRLDKVFTSIDRSAESHQCEGMKGIIEEGEQLLKTEAAPDVKDALMIHAAQKVEHYEIATYGTLCSWAKMLGYDEAFDLLKETLNEEKQTDEKLTQLAEQVVNREALKKAA